MRATPLELPEVVLIEPRVHRDARGFFLETWRRDAWAAAGIGADFVQDNHSRSAPGVLRGLHYQLRQPQGKLVRCTQGAIFDVAVDIRRGSPTFGRWVAAVLSAENHHQLWVPAGFAHGFAVMEGPAEVLYRCTAYYEPLDDRGVRWDDPCAAIAWPLSEPTLSPKDAALPLLTADREDLPEYGR